MTETSIEKLTEDPTEKLGKPTRRQLFGIAAAGSVGATLLGMGPRAAQAANRGRSHYQLFSEGRIGSMRLKNRLVRSAAYENGGDPTKEGTVTADYLRIHRNYAEGGVGLIITGYMAVREHGKPLPTQVSAYHDRFLPGLKSVADTVHGAGTDAKIVAEIGDDGRALTDPKLISPSGLNWEGAKEGHEMTAAEIAQFCTDMADATARLQTAGFDGVEIHGAHHYLIDTFLSPFTNRRTDSYGGSLYKRVAIVREMVSKMRDRVGPDYPILIKLNCDDGATDDDYEGGEVDYESFPHLVKAIVDTGVDAIDISGSERPGDPLRMGISTAREQSYYLRYAESITDEPVPIILGCGNRNVELLEYFLQLGKFEFVSFARPLVREPDLPNRWLAGRGPANADCISCNLCFRSLSTMQPVHCIQLERQQNDATLSGAAVGAGGRSFGA